MLDGVQQWCIRKIVVIISAALPFYSLAGATARHIGRNEHLGINFLFLFFDLTVLYIHLTIFTHIDGALMNKLED